MAIYYDRILKMANDSERELRNVSPTDRPLRRHSNQCIEPADVPRAIVYERGHNHV
jgi:hypothetical protein